MSQKFSFLFFISNMKINCIKPCAKENFIAFKSGISRKNKKDFAKISISKAEDEFLRSKTHAKFKNNQQIAVLNLLISSFLKNNDTLFEVDLKLSPPRIRVFDKNEEYCPLPDTFCLKRDKKIIKNENIYPQKSILFKNIPRNFDEINNLTEELYRKRLISSDNFLHMALHEWAHSLHLAYLEKNTENIKNIEYDNLEKEIIGEFLGEYAYNNSNPVSQEVVAEAFCKILAETLSKKSFAQDKSLDETLASYPKEFIALVEKSL